MKGKVPMVILGFAQHKAAGWKGVIYTNRYGEQCIANGSYSWLLTKERRDAVRDIPVEEASLSSMVQAMEEACEKNPFFGPPRYLVQALQDIAKERGGAEA